MINSRPLLTPLKVYCSNNTAILFSDVSSRMNLTQGMNFI